MSVVVLRTGTELLHPVKALKRVELRQGDRVADFGCGALGHFVFPAAQMVGGVGAVYAVDIQLAALERIEKIAREQQLWNIYPVWADIDVYGSVRVDTGSLDCTLLINNLFLSQDRHECIREMARLTRSGGRLLIIDWKKLHTPLGPLFEQRVDPEEAKRLFHNSFFTLQDEFEAGPYHYGLIYSRTGQAC